MSVENLELYTRTESLLNTIYPALGNFPRSEKFSLVQDIKQNFYELLKYIRLANRVPAKKTYYAQEADGYLEIIRILIKLSKERKYISKPFYRKISLELTVIGRQLGAYIRTS